jgi:hypothetical protein
MLKRMVVSHDWSVTKAEGIFQAYSLYGKKYRELADIVGSIVCFITLPLNNIDDKMLKEWSDQEVGKFLVFSDLNVVVDEFILQGRFISNFVEWRSRVLAML